MIGRRNKLSEQPRAARKINSYSRQIAQEPHPNESLSELFFISAWQLSEKTGFTPRVLKTYRDWINHSKLTDESHAHLLNSFRSEIFENQTAHGIIMRALRVGDMRGELIELFRMGHVDDLILRDFVLFQKLISPS